MILLLLIQRSFWYWCLELSRSPSLFLVFDSLLYAFLNYILLIPFRSCNLRSPAFFKSYCPLPGYQQAEEHAAHLLKGRFHIQQQWQLRGPNSRTWRASCSVGQEVLHSSLKLILALLPSSCVNIWLYNMWLNIHIVPAILCLPNKLKLRKILR